MTDSPEVACIEAAATIATTPIEHDDAMTGIDAETRDAARAYLRQQWAYQQPEGDDGAPTD